MERVGDALEATSHAHTRVHTLPPRRRHALAVPRRTWDSARERSWRLPRAHPPRHGLGRGAERHATCTREPAVPLVRSPRTHAKGRHTSRIYALRCLAMKQGCLCTCPAINGLPSQLPRVSSPPLPAIAAASCEHSLRSLPPLAKAS
jgi:hypothetical protein